MAAIHPSIEVLKAFGHGNLDDTQAGAVSRHIDTCSDCLNTVASLSGDTFLGRVQDAHARPAMPPVIPPELLNHPEYEDIVELSRGGMGVVYVARQRLMNRHVALKIINQSLLNEPGATERFVREIQAAATLDHPNIVKAYTAFQAGRLVVFVMEYVAGEDLGQLVRRIGPLPVPNACGYAQQAARGLQHAFEKGLVHRDIKPQNIMLTARGIKPHIKHVVKILDFGLAKARKSGATRLNVTGTGSFLGTPHYSAPEQIEDAARADIRADLYSLGCTLYFLLTGAPPFDGASEIKLLDAHRHDKARSVKAVRPEVPGELSTIVDRLLLKKPADRYQTPREVAEALAPFFKAGIKSIRLSEDPPTPTPKQAQPSGEPLRPTVADGSRVGGIPVATLAPPIPPTVFENPDGRHPERVARGNDEESQQINRTRRIKPRTKTLVLLAFFFVLLAGLSIAAWVLSAPSAPTGLTATAGARQVVLNWTATAGATSYDIYRATSSGEKGNTPYHSGVTSTSFTDTGLTAGTTYYYTVSAVTGRGQSPHSDEVSTTPTVPFHPPTVPSSPPPDSVSPPVGTPPLVFSAPPSIVGKWKDNAISSHTFEFFADGRFREVTAIGLTYNGTYSLIDAEHFKTSHDILGDAEWQYSLTENTLTMTNVPLPALSFRYSRIIE